MRIVGWLLLLMGVLFGAQALYYRSKANRLGREAIAKLPHDPRGAYDTIRPALALSGAITLGRAPRVKEQFFAALRDRLTADLAAPPLAPEWFAMAEGNLRVLDEASKSRKTPMAGRYQADVARALKAAEPQLRRNLGLAAWDAYVGLIDVSARGDLLPSEAIPDLEAWLRQLKEVDRREIARREAAGICREAMVACAQALRRVPSAEPQDPFISALKIKLEDRDLIDADRAIERGKAAVALYRAAFPNDALPPELAAYGIKLDLNQVAMRITHLLQLGERALNPGSGYITQLLVGPGSGAVPSNAELYGAFVNGLAGHVAQIVETARAADALPAGEGPALQLLAVWTQNGYARLVRDGELAQATTRAYQGLMPAAQRTPDGAEVIRHIRSSLILCIVVR